MNFNIPTVVTTCSMQVTYSSETVSSTSEDNSLSSVSGQGIRAVAPIASTSAGAGALVPTAGLSEGEFIDVSARKGKKRKLEDRHPEVVQYNKKARVSMGDISLKKGDITKGSLKLIQGVWPTKVDLTNHMKENKEVQKVDFQERLSTSEQPKGSINWTANETITSNGQESVIWLFINASTIDEWSDNLNELMGLLNQGETVINTMNVEKDLADLDL